VGDQSGDLQFNGSDSMPMEYMNDLTMLKAQGKSPSDFSCVPATYGQPPVDTRSDLVKQIEELELASESIGEIRATLMANFSKERAHDGIRVKEHPSTLRMLIDVLEQYSRKVAGHPAPFVEPFTNPRSGMGIQKT